MFSDTVLPLGLYHEQQACFDHKPWVESELRRFGIPTIPWIYVSALNVPKVSEFLGRGAPFVVRWPRSRGGAGIWIVRGHDDLVVIPPSPMDENIFCLSPYFESAFSVNVNACVFPSGEVTIHGASVQLVGIEACTPRPLGYCGNDFSAIADLPAQVLTSLDSVCRGLGSWLARHGYIGAFGFDAIVVEERVLFVELNPRFQASSAVAARIDRMLDRPDQYANHVAAFLGLPAEDNLSLPDLVREQEPVSHVVIYNGIGGSASYLNKPEMRMMDVSLLPNSSIIVEPLGILAAILWKGSVTVTGQELQNNVRAAVRELKESFYPVQR
jgi:hypothetical protein